MEKNKMGYVPIPKLITTMSLPIIFSMLIQALYNVVDSIFVSRISEDALTAISLAFPMQLIVIAAFVGLGIGINSAISRKLGEKDHKTAVQIAEHGVVIAFVLYFFVALLGAFVIKYLFLGFSIGSFTFNGFTDNQTIINYSVTYTQIVMVFSFGSILNQAGRSVFQGTGEMIKPMVAQLIGAITNIILDAILIFGLLGFPALGVKGAAIATVIAQIIAMVYIWIQLFSGKSIITLKLKEFKLNVKIIKEIIVVGIPSAIMQGLGSIMLFSMNFILSRFGDAAIAVMGVYFKVQSMVFMPIFGLSVGTMSVIGFNYGAKDKKRMKAAIKFSTIAAVSFMTLCLFIFQLFPVQLLNMFNASSEMIDIGVNAFRTISLIFPLIAVTIIFSSSFQAFGKAYFSLLVSIVRQLLVLIPTAFILAGFSNINLVWFAFVIAEFIGIITTSLLFRKTFKKSVALWDEHNI